MPFQALLREAHQLKQICQRLELLAEEHPHLTDAVLTISGSIRNTAVLLEVLVATKGNPPSPLSGVPN